MEQYFTPNNNITFPEPQPDINALLNGVDPEDLVPPDVQIAKILFSQGWGSEGKGEALLYIGQKADGSYTWEAIIIAHYGFDLSGR